eukprot:jgi/Tetstr1/463691/TSEL_008552.t1
MGADTRGVRAKHSDLLLQHDVAVRRVADVAEENRRLRCQALGGHQLTIKRHSSRNIKTARINSGLCHYNESPEKSG